MEPIYHANVCDNASVHLASAAPTALSRSNFMVKEEQISPGNLQEGETLVQNLFISLDPYLRNFMKPGSPVSVGQVLRGYGVCRVVACKSAHFKVGQLLMGIVGWEQFSILEANICPSDELPVIPEYVVAGVGETFPNTMFVIPEDQASAVPLSYNVGALGMPGLTAYTVVNEAVQPPGPNETVFVSAASGAVGQLVGQLAKMRGCHVVGSAGSDEKVKLLREEFGYDGAFNYRAAGSDISGALRTACPNGIDFYVDGVGGKMLDAVFEVANRNARIVVIGSISGYDSAVEPLYKYHNVVGKAITVKGIFVVDYRDKYKDFRTYMIDAIKAGKLKCQEDVVEEGVDHMPDAYVNLMHGKNLGKLVVKVGGP